VAELQPGELLADRYRVHGALGRGGMATVYLAVDEQTGERVALKLLHAHLAADPAARRRLEREVRAAGRLDHDGVLVAREMIEADGQVGLVLPLHTGRTLAERVAVGGPLPPDQVRRVGLRLAEALGAAHLAGVLHRDVSPRNVLMDDRGAPVLTDFGMARMADQRTARSTALLGTAGFVAPEVLAGERADPRSDLYGLGAVLYQAATGVEPFAADHPSAALQQQLAGPPPSIRDRVPDFPEWLDALILGLLDPDPDRRPQGAAALSLALEEGRAPAPAGAAVDAAADATAADSPEASTALVRARLPEGGFTVVVRESEDDHRRRRWKRRRAARRVRRRHGRGGDDLAGTIEDVAVGIRDALTGQDPVPVEERLRDAVARAADLPADALDPTRALAQRRFRLVSGVDRATADQLANEARLSGLKASVHPTRQPDDPVGWLMSRWWVLIPLMWIAFPAVMAMGAPDLTVFLFTALTVALPTIVGPWVGRRMLPASARDLPVAYGADLRPALATGWAAEAPVEPASEPASEPVQAPSRAALVVQQAVDALDVLAAGLEEGEDLAEVVRAELRASLRELRREVDALAEDVRDNEAALSRAAPAGADAWAAERLARLDTLARAGEAVDGEERARLKAAVAAHDAALAAEQALDSRQTADLARLLEIAATARRLERELRVEHTDRRAPEEAMDDLRRRAQAAARARQELAGR